MRETRAIVLANQKGGVGKTTSALNIAFGLSRRGRRVLLVDMDPQATATTSLLTGGAAEAHRQGRTIAHVILQGAALAKAIIPVGEAVGERCLAFDLVAGHIELADIDSRREPGFEVALREALETVQDSYDHIIIDAPPNLGMLTWMALAASGQVIVPVRTEPYDTMGVGLILGTINKVQRRLNQGLRLYGILPTQYARRKLVDREVLAQFVVALAGKVPVLEPIADSAVFGHAARDGRIALEAFPTAAATLAYAGLADALAAGTASPALRMPVLAPVCV